MDKVRVLRIIEYVGPREIVEQTVSKSIQGERTYGWKGEQVTIRAATLGLYPEILEQLPEDEHLGVDRDA